MNRFFNLIPSGDSCCILLYGIIGEGQKEVSSTQVASELLEAEMLYKKIDIRINSKGGDVYAGIAMFNAIRNSKADITIYIDGVAASMASVIATCGKRVIMNRYSRLMIHNIQGGCFGNKDELRSCVDELVRLEDLLAEMYSAKTGLSKEQIKNNYFDGKDHWLTAEEALDIGFIDEIYDSEPLPDDTTVEQIYSYYQNKLNTNSKQNKMIDKLKKIPMFANVASEEDALKRIEELEAENKALKKECEDSRKREKEAIKAELVAILDTAQKEGRFTAECRDGYMVMLEANREAGTKVINSLKPTVRILDLLGDEKPKTSFFSARMSEIEKNLNKR